MTFQLKSALLVLAAIAAVSNVAPLAKADDWSRETVVTFNEAVEVPGMSLPAGTYVFKLYDSNTDRDIVEVLSKDERVLLTTFMGVPTILPSPANTTIMTFDERPAGTPEAIKNWFYPGDETGIQFIYRK